jgi:hypothetical protein
MPLFLAQASFARRAVLCQTSRCSGVSGTMLGMPELLLKSSKRWFGLTTVLWLSRGNSLLSASRTPGVPLARPAVPDLTLLLRHFDNTTLTTLSIWLDFSTWLCLGGHSLSRSVHWVWRCGGLVARSSLLSRLTRSAFVDSCLGACPWFKPFRRVASSLWLGRVIHEKARQGG